MINVLNFKTSALELGGAHIPAIAYDGLRLKIDPSRSNVVVNGQTFPVAVGSYVKSQGRTFVPSGSPTETDIDFGMPFSGADGTVQLLVDFDAYDSVNIVNNVAQIAPKLHGAVYQQSGVIVGTILNRAKSPVSGATVQALNLDGTVAATAASGNDGSFELHGIGGGAYSIVVLNTYTNDAGVTLTAQNNDPGITVNPISFSLPSGYKLNLGNIRD
jgi:Carboxypeptidase regulatory-like domain